MLTFPDLARGSRNPTNLTQQPWMSVEQHTLPVPRNPVNTFLAPLLFFTIHPCSILVLHPLIFEP